MIKNLTKYSVAKEVTINVINDDRFKSGKISINMYVPLNYDTVSSYSILPFILSKSCNKYKSFESLNKKLNDLYGASVYSDVSKVGDILELSISASFLDSRYTLYNENTFLELTNLLCDLLFDPNVNNEEFSKDILEQEKRQLIELIESEKNDKKILAKNKCIEAMCKNEKFSINKYGTKEQVAQLTGTDIYKSWKKLLETSKIEIMIIGKTDGESAIQAFKNSFSKINRKDIVQCSSEIIESAKVPQEFIDKMDIMQSKLVLGFRTGSKNNNAEIMATRVMTALYGITPQSKLFMNVREKLSLCYYCSALYDRYKGIMLVQSGVQKENIEKAKVEILNQLDEIKKGNFTDDSLKAIKLSLANNYKTIGDYISNLENFYINQNLDNEFLSPEDFINLLENVTREDVIKAANAVTLDTVYILTDRKKV